MSRAAKAIRFLCLVVLLVCLGGFFALYSKQLITFDQYYHFAVSKLMVDQGVLLLLPQVDDLGWGQQFPEKEFLFHVGTMAWYAVFSEQGVRLFCLLCAVGVLLLSFAELQRFISPVFAFSILLLLYFLESSFAFRLILVRPHVLAILWFVLAYIGLRSRSPWLTLIAGFGYALSYHALYVPLLLIAISLVLQTLVFTERSIRVELFGIVGVLLGTGLNPYFPASFQIGWQHLWMALTPNNEIPLYYIGAELLPIRLNTYLKTFWPHLLAAVTALVALLVLLVRRRAIRKSEFGYPLLLSCASAGFFLLLSAKSARAHEYAAPLAAFALGQAIAVSSLTVRRVIGAAIAVAILIKAPSLRSVADRGVPLEATRIANALQAIEQIPEENVNAKVFTCHWDIGSLMLYARDKQRFVDVLDPRLLYLKNRQKALMRLAVFNRRVADPTAMVRQLFAADYILCGSEAAIPLFEQDPRLERLYPIDRPPKAFGYTPGLELGLYRLLPEASEAFVREFRITPVDEGGTVESQPKNLQLTLDEEPGIFNVFPDIAAWSRSTFSGREASPCLMIQPTEQERQRLRGRTVVGLSVNAPATLLLGQEILLELPQGTVSTPVAQRLELNETQSAESISLHVCPSPNKKSWGASLSFFTKN